jgi:4-amino-4-deoxy-L-arabinose transferase-like glycosyltransferase
MRGWFARFWPALALAMLALVLRCYGVTAPLLDYHSWRQADTAAIARNYATNGFHLLAPQVDWGGQTPGYVESEFPLYSYSLALLYGVFGIHDWLGRLLTALASAVAVGALYGLALALWDRRAAVYAALALALLPFSIYFGRTVMPDTLMLLTAILALWTFYRWLERRSAGRFVVALLCGILAPLAKTPNVLICAVPLAYLTWAYRPPRAAWVALAVYGLCFAAPSLLWMRHARDLPLDPHISFGIGEKLFDTTLLRDPHFYLLLARSSVRDVLTLAGLPFFVVGLASARSADQSARDAGPVVARVRWFPHAWLVGALVFLCASAAGVVGQDYYILPLAGPGALLIGLGLAHAQRYLASPGENTALVAAQSHTGARLVVLWWKRLVPVLGVMGIAALSFVRVAPLYQTTDFYRTLGQRVDLALPAGERVGVIAPAVSEILYYAGRRGWRLDAGVIVPGGLSSLPPLGVRYLLITDPWLTERSAVLTQALHDYRRVAIGPYALLLDLARPGLQRPAELVGATGHLVEEPFLSIWKAGGVERLGYPLSDALDGPEGREQYFERALLVRHAALVERAPVGRLLLAAQGRAPQPAPVADAFRAAWERAGAEATLGAVLSPALDSGDGGRIQYFEYGMLEASAGGVPGLGAAGRRLLEARGLTEERQILLAAGH